MTKVFIGGSRHLSRLAAPVSERIERIVEKHLPIVVGDANGADKAVQTYLNKQNYRDVQIFCAGATPRNNVGLWGVRSVEPGFVRGSLDFYTAKDRAMTDEATVGLMVWDGKSTGTLLNVARLLRQHKKVALYVSTDSRFRDLKHLGQWDEFISNYPIELRKKVSERAAAEGENSNSVASGQPARRRYRRLEVAS